MPLARTVRTLVMASLVTPPFVGAIAWEMLAAPNSGLLNQLWRAAHRRAGRRGAVRHLHADGPDLRHRLLHLSLRLHPGRQRARPHAGRARGRLVDAGRAAPGQTARRITVPLALPTLLAGALVAFLQALNLFGSPAILAIPAGFHTLTTKIWSLFQFPPKPELAAAAVAAAAAAHRGCCCARQSLVLGRRGYAVLGGKYGAPRAHPARRPALAGRGAGDAGARRCRSSCPTRRCSTPPSRASPRSS